MNRSLMPLGLLLALSGGCADLLGVQELTGIDASAGSASDGGSDASLDTGTDTGFVTGLDAGGDAAGDALPADASPAETSPGCTPAWVDASVGQVPPGAVPDLPLDAGWVDYVCRVWSGDAAYPGKLVMPWYCYYGDVDGEVPASYYQVLVPAGCPTVAWEPAPAGVTPPYTLPCGQDLQGLPLYSCRRDDSEGGTGDLGYMGLGTNHLCVYSFSGQTLTIDTYDVLTVH
jgi:hypothetical protein